MLNKALLYRIIDANINRAVEGLRVVEEVCRFILRSRSLTNRLKIIRHKIFDILETSDLKKFIGARRMQEDAGRYLDACELKRKDIGSIFFANLQRVKESIRVLEEYYKLINTKKALEFKRLRYLLYELEKKISKKLSSLLASG